MQGLLSMGPTQEADKLKSFRRADFCVQNFPDDKKVRTFKFCDNFFCKLIFAAKVLN